MAYESWSQIKAFIIRHIPDLFTKRKLNFITIHYIYMIGMSLLFSVLIFVIGGMEYIDALFFSSGSCTQSGLNTIDFNLLRTSQQILIYVACMFTNPIFINSSVVFVRLYWFEKRFKDIVRDARDLRRTKSRSRASFSTDDPESLRHEHGTRGRSLSQILAGPIHLMHLGQHEKSKDGNQDEQEKEGVHTVDKPVNSSSSSNSDQHQYEMEQARRRNNRRRSSGDVRLPSQLSPEDHIAVLERQRNPDDHTVLYIPGPRDFERGERPENLNDEEDDDRVGPLRTITNPERPQSRGITFQNQEHPNAPTHITIDEPVRPRRPQKTNTFPQALTDRSRDGTSPTRVPQDRRRSYTVDNFRRSNTARSELVTPYLSYEPTITRNSYFVNLTEEQREELGGIEYRALKTLALVLVCYFFFFHILGIIILTPWIMTDDYFGDVVTSIGQGRPWWGVFTAASAFNDLGFTLNPDSMVSFNTAAVPLLLMTFLIVIGNTGFPCMLRFTIWMLTKLVPTGSAVWEELQFLLDHPRRCFTLLFPRGATWWLFGILVILNGLDLILYIILDLNDPAVTDVPGGFQFLDGLFQASSTRTAGFAVTDLGDLHPGIQVSYLIMMYISVFPIAISMRRTNVYEEKSLGIYATTEEQDEDGREPSYVGAHLRRQLSFDLWYVFLGLFFICIIEGSRIENTNDYAFTIFSILFEIVSAYGTVGLSLGYPGINASFSAEFKKLSKLIIIAMQIRGRHRGLPYELDRAILLPSEGLQEKEAIEGQKMMARRRSSAGGLSTMSAVDGTVGHTNFRPETGLSSGVHNPANDARNRTTPNPIGGAGQAGADHVSPAGTVNNSNLNSEQHSQPGEVRHGFGSMMFAVANAPDVIKEAKHRKSRSASSSGNSRS